TLSRYHATVVCADLDKDAAARAASEITQSGHAAIAIRLDVAAQDEVDAAIARTVSEFGGLHILANVAGISGRPTGLLDATEDSLDQVFAVNVKGTLFGCQAAARVMPNGGSIVNLASAAYDLAGSGNSVYALSKAAVVFITRSLALELAPQGIRVNCI